MALSPVCMRHTLRRAPPLILSALSVVALLAGFPPASAAIPSLRQLADMHRHARLGHRSTTSTSISTALVQRILDLVNVERNKQNLPFLTWNGKLTAAAQSHADDMQSHSYFNHVTPEGLTPTDRMKAAGYVHPTCNCSWKIFYGENIAHGQTSPEEVMKDWMGSPEHRANILSPDFKDLGVGIAGTYWVEDFGGVQT